MHDLDRELWKMGIPSKTKHNEVAPAQYEMAPVFTTTNIAADQNQLVMETMQKVALRHGLACLLHRKAVRGRQRIGQAQQLVSGHRRRHQPVRTRPHAASRTSNSCCFERVDQGGR